MKKILFLISILIVLTNCSKEPEPINYNKDECAHCMMQITDPKFGSELVTDKGKIYKFDSIECMADYVSSNRGFKIDQLWISDYANPNNLINAETAFYLVSSKIESPMSANLAGFKTEIDRGKFYAELTGQKLNWKDVLSYVNHKK